MDYFCNMDYDVDSGKWWIDAFDNWPSDDTTRTYYDTKEFRSGNMVEDNIFIVGNKKIIFEDGYLEVYKNGTIKIGSLDKMEKLKILDVICLPSACLGSGRVPPWPR